MVGMDPETGRLLSGLDRLRASIADILAAPLGSRRERPDYGSRLPRMIDQPQTAGWIQAAQAEAGRAIKRWETSFAFERAGQRWLTTSAALQDIRDVLLAGSVPDEQWVTAARQVVPMTLPELQSLWQAITARGAQIYQRRLEIEQQITGMSREQLEAFVPGWPVSSQEAVA